MDLVIRLAKMSQSMKLVNLEQFAQAVDTIIDDMKSERPLLEAEPTDQPGTWVKPSGELIKKSKDPSNSAPINVLPATPNVDPTQTQQLSTPSNTVGF